MYIAPKSDILGRIIQEKLSKFGWTQLNLQFKNDQPKTSKNIQGDQVINHFPKITRKKENSLPTIMWGKYVYFRGSISS